MELKSISPSDLNRFSNCPRKWQLGKTKKVGVTVPDEARLYGTAVHNCIVLYFQKIPDKPSAEDIEVVAKEAFEEGTTFAMKGFKAKTRRVIENFVGFEQKRLRSWKQYKPMLVGKWMKAKVFEDVPEFHVIIDFYGEADATIIDWKTGKGGMRDGNLRQGKTYELVLMKLGFEVRRVMFVNLDLGTNLPVPRVTAGWIYKVARRMVDMCGADRFPKNPSGLCGWCPWILDCEFSDVCLWMGI